MPNNRKPYLTTENHQAKLTQWKETLAPLSKPNKESKINNSALLVIDMQDYFLNPESHAYTTPGTVVINNIKQLIEYYRKHNRPIIFTYFSTQPGEPDPLSKWWNTKSITHDNLSPELDIQPTDLIIRKNTYSTFHAPENQKLKKLLQDTDTTQVIVTGVLTNLCCETAAREAFQHNLDVFVPLDATATRSEDMHLASLTNLAYGFTTINTTQEIIK